MISGRINVTRIDKAKLYKGEKGTYLKFILRETPESPYGDYMIVQETTKEERAAGKYGAILGNAKIMGKGLIGKRPKPEPELKPEPAEPEEDGDGVPF